MAFVFGEIVAIYDQTALLCLTVLFVLPEIIRRISSKKEKTAWSKTIISFDIFLIFIFSICFSVTGYYLTDKEVKNRNSIYLMEEQQVTVSGEISKITETENGVHYIVKIERLKTMTDILLLIESKETYDVKLGNKVVISGRMEQFANARNQGNFSLQKYYMSLGIYGKIQCLKLQVTDRRCTIVKESLRVLKQEIGKKLNEICNDENRGIFKICSKTNRGIIKAMILGDKQELDAEVKSLYQLNGISHILAISGLHISLVGMFIYSLIRKKMKLIPAALVSMIFVLLFALLTGFGIATVRATIMFVMKIVGEVLGRSYDALTSIAMACILIVSFNPFVLLNSGFQMSFVAIIGANILWKTVYQFIQQKGRLWKSVRFSFTISVVMNPMIAWYYYQIPVYSQLLNIIVIFFMSVILVSGFAGIVTAYIYLPVGKFLMIPSCGILQLYTALCNMVSKLPGYNVICGKPSMGIIILYYGIIFAGVLGMKVWLRKEEKEKREKKISRQGEVVESEKEKKTRQRRTLIRKYIYLWMICVIVTLSLFVKIHKGLEVNFIDVGQGDGILMQTKEVTITVDGGSSNVTEVGKYRIIPFLKAKGVRKIDYAIVSHWDSDHISGLQELLEQSGNGGIKVKNIIVSKTNIIDKEYIALVTLAKKKAVKVYQMKQGDKMGFGNLKITCLHPDDTFHATERNEYSNVLKVEYQKFNMLLTGDVGTETEPYFLELLKESYAVLKVPHHGSKNSTSEEFLRQIAPKYAIISAGQSNVYGHPHQEVIERLKRQGVQTYCTKECGEITLKTDGIHMNICGYLF